MATSSPYYSIGSNGSLYVSDQNAYNLGSGSSIGDDSKYYSNPFGDLASARAGTIDADQNVYSGGTTQTNYQATGGAAYYGPSAEELEAQRQAAELEKQKNIQLGFYDQSIGNLNDLLGRTDTSLNQGISKLDADYQKETGFQTANRDKANAGYDEQDNDNKTIKESNYNTINKNARNGYRSLAQIIGRASGTGSSAFREMLPDVVGKDTSGKRTIANETYGRNMQKVGKARDETRISFESILQDLAEQRRSGEGALRGEIEGQRQSINGQLQGIQAQRAAAAGGDVNAIRAATDPYTRAITESRNKVQGFFDQYKPQYNRQNLTATRPELSQYTADRSLVNAGASGGSQQAAENPYAEMLRKKQQEGAVA